MPVVAMVSSIPDTSLGLTAAELATFRAHQAVALNGASIAGSSRASIASASTRGRGASRSSIASSSRAGSAASSHQGAAPGRLMLDAGSLSVLGAYFERLMVRIQDRMDYLTQQTTRAASSQSMRAANSIANADAEIARFKEIMRQIDELEMEFDKVRSIRDVVKRQRARVEEISKGLSRSSVRR